MTGWREIKLKEVCEYVTVGYVGSMADEYIDDGVPFLRSLNVKPFYIDYNNLKFISKQFHEKLKKSALRPGDVVVVRTGYPGTASVIPDDLPVSNCSDLVVIRPGKDLNPHFLAAIFNSAFGQNMVSGSTVGAAQQHFNVTVAKELVLNLPEKLVQDKIGSVLSAYDDLIENNKRRIVLLEKMAEEIYREWFVRFRFPGYQTAEFEKGIPKGWNLGKIEGLVLDKYLETGKRPKGGAQDEGVPSVGAENVLGLARYNFEKEKYVPEHFFESMKKGIIEDRDVLFYKDGAEIGRVTLFQDGFPHEKMCVNEHVFILRTDKKIYQYFLYFYFSQTEIREYVHLINKNAAQPGINRSELKSIPVLMPSDELIEHFNDRVGSTVSQIFNLAKTNQKLIEIKNTLLPRLISGKLDVNDLEILFPPSMNDGEAA